MRPFPDSGPFAGGMSDCGNGRFTVEGTAAFATQRDSLKLCFVSFALSGAEDYLAQSDDTQKLTRLGIGRCSPLSDLCMFVDKFGRPFM